MQYKINIKNGDSNGMEDSRNKIQVNVKIG